MNLSAERTRQVRRAFRWLAVLIFALTAVQPVTGAFGFFRSGDDMDYTAMHEMTANILALLVLILLGLTFLAGFQHAYRVRVWAGALMIAVVAQIGLGYSARDDTELLALHIPIGVAAFAFALVIMLLAFGLRFDRSSA